MVDYSGRTFTNVAGKTFDASKTTIVYAEDLNDIVGALEGSEDTVLVSARNVTTVERDALTARTGMLVWNTTTSEVQTYNGSSWETVGGVADHGALTGLSDDDHTQYHTDARALVWLGTRSTTDLSEGSNLYFTDERVDDRVSSLVVDGAALTWTYNDVANTLTGNIDIDSLTADASPDGATDYLVSYDASDGAHKKVLIDNLPGGGSPGGSDGQVQYNDGGSFGGASSVHYDKVNGRIGVNTTSPQDRIHFVGALRLQNEIDGENIFEFRDAAGNLKARYRTFASGFDWALNNSNDVGGISFTSAGRLSLASQGGIINFPADGGFSASGAQLMQWSFTSNYFLVGSHGSLLLTVIGNETLNHQIRIGATRIATEPVACRVWMKNVTPGDVSAVIQNAASQTVDAFQVRDSSGNLLWRIATGGTQGPPIETVSVDTTLDDTHSTVIVDASGANRTITLPTAASADQLIYTVKKKDSSSNTVTIDGNASDTIDGATTKVLSSQYDFVTMQSDGTEWWVIG